MILPYTQNPDWMRGFWMLEFKISRNFSLNLFGWTYFDCRQPAALDFPGMCKPAAPDLRRFSWKETVTFLEIAFTLPNNRVCSWKIHVDRNQTMQYVFPGKSMSIPTVSLELLLHKQQKLFYCINKTLSCHRCSYLAFNVLHIQHIVFNFRHSFFIFFNPK